MPRTVTILRVFVASPSDVQEERDYLEGIVRELNVIWSREGDIQLELVKWETHALPGIGIDAQDVVNQQLGDDYDIFIGILWTRFGTPTGRAGSGTEEEFNRAYQRYKEAPHELRIMFYFKETPVSIGSLDSEQLTLLQSFQRQLGEKGTLYWTYSEREEFGSLIRVHLSGQVQEWRKSWGIQRTRSIDPQGKEPSEASSLAQVELSPLDTPVEEEGFLDLVEVGQDEIEVMTESSFRMAEAINALSTRVELRTPALQESSTNSDVRQMRRVFDAVATDLDNFAARMETEIPIFSESYTKGMDALSRAVSFAQEFVPQEPGGIQEALAAVSLLIPVIDNTHQAIVGFRASVAGLPRATTLFKRARRRTLEVLDKLSQELLSALNITSEVQKGLERFLDDSNPSSSPEQ
jgi:hypothetical protein